MKKHPLVKLDISGNEFSKKIQKLYTEELKDKNLKLKFEDDDEEEEDELANALSQLTIWFKKCKNSLLLWMNIIKIYILYFI